MVEDIVQTLAYPCSIIGDFLLWFGGYSTKHLEEPNLIFIVQPAMAYELDGFSHMYYTEDRFECSFFV